MDAQALIVGNQVKVETRVLDGLRELPLQSRSRPRSAAGQVARSLEFPCLRAKARECRVNGRCLGRCPVIQGRLRLRDQAADLSLRFQLQAFRRQWTCGVGMAYHAGLDSWLEAVASEKRVFGSRIVGAMPMCMTARALLRVISVSALRRGVRLHTTVSNEDIVLR